jgi:hypothetical protein
VRAVLQDPRYEVRQIFVYAPLRARLLAYAAKIGAPLDVRTKAAAAMMQPGNALPHDDHFHIRISCPADQVAQGCLDLPLWHSPGSPDEFGPELLVESNAPSPAIDVPLEAWGSRLSLWSLERGICNSVEPMCEDRDDGPMCEDLEMFGVTDASAPPPDAAPVTGLASCDAPADPIACSADGEPNACSISAAGASDTPFAME